MQYLQQQAIYRIRRYVYAGIGKGTKEPDKDFIDFVYESFRAMEKGLAMNYSA